MSYTIKKSLQKEHSPCLHCEDREPGCHGKCEKYAKWVEPIVKAREERLQYNKARGYDVDRFVKERDRKRRKNGKSLR